jgi:hypothetical protein
MIYARKYKFTQSKALGEINGFVPDSITTMYCMGRKQISVNFYHQTTFLA